MLEAFARLADQLGFPAGFVAVGYAFLAYRGLSYDVEYEMDDDFEPEPAAE